MLNVKRAAASSVPLRQTPMTNEITRHFLDEDRIELPMHRCTEDREVTSATMTALCEIARQRYLMRNSANVPAPLSYAENETENEDKDENVTSATMTAMW